MKNGDQTHCDIIYMTTYKHCIPTGERFMDFIEKKFDFNFGLLVTEGGVAVLYGY